MSIRPRLTLPLAALALLLAFGTAVHDSRAGTPSQELQSARDTFLEGNYQDAIPLLTGLLYPTGRLAAAADLAEAHVLLAVCYFETGKQDLARREFEEALFLDSGITLHAKTFSPGAVALFDATKAEMERKALEAAKRAKQAENLKTTKEKLQNLFVTENRHYWINFMPFGAGQFQNGQKSKGRFFFIAQATTGGTSLALWSYQVMKYGWGGKVPPEDVSTVNTLQVIQVASASVAIGAWAWGVIDSLSNYQHSISRPLDPEIYEELDKLTEDQEETAMPTIMPSLGPGQAGVSLSWEY